ncbi:MAG TPA: hypothetical protein VFU59_12675 [Candidatus Eisenbacteria bacterium]|nr:hypothetical protein [Candidatus Eisenbacteria bacterium]
MWWAYAAAASLAFGLLSCDGTPVTEPPPGGVKWERLTATAFRNCVYPDLTTAGDSLVFSFTLGELFPDPNNPGGFIAVDHNRGAVCGSDGQDVIPLRHPGAAAWNDYRHRWAGSQIVVYESNRNGNFDIWYRNLDYNEDRRLTGFDNTAANESSPAPRPNSPGLAYIEYGGPIPAGGSTLRGRVVLIPDTAAVPIQRIYLTGDSLYCGEPDWDPTGQKLVFTVENQNDLTRHLYTMNLAPGDSLPVQITVGASHDFSPRWSPDGGRILFSSDRTGRWGVWIVNPTGQANGLQVVAFDDAGAVVLTPIFTPDGSSIIASSNGRGGYRSLWLLTNLPPFEF